MPWHGGGPAVGKPTNALTGATYRGINVVALWAEACVRGYGSGHWATYRQWATVGAQVRRGEQASAVVFYKKLETNEPEEGEEVNGRLVAKASPVFNAEQVDGWVLDLPLQASLVERINDRGRGPRRWFGRRLHSVRGLHSDAGNGDIR